MFVERPLSEAHEMSTNIHKPTTSATNSHPGKVNFSAENLLEARALKKQRSVGRDCNIQYASFHVNSTEQTDRRDGEARQPCACLLAQVCVPAPPRPPRLSSFKYEQNRFSKGIM